MPQDVSSISLAGAFCFGLVVGWITYRTLRRAQVTGLGDIATVIGAVGGTAVLALFPGGTALFGIYGIGLAVGFFGYLISALALASRAGQSATVYEWMGAGTTSAPLREEEHVQLPR
jgi:hypothetical protein